MGQTRMFRDRVVSMEQTLEGGEKHLELLKGLCLEAFPDFPYRDHALDHERDLFVVILEAPDGRRKTVGWTRMTLFDAERIPALAADPQGPLRAKLVGFLQERASRSEILVTFRHLEEGWTDTPEPRPSRRRRRRGGSRGGSPRPPEKAPQGRPGAPRPGGGAGPRGVPSPGPRPAPAPPTARPGAAPPAGEARPSSSRRRSRRRRRGRGGSPGSGPGPGPGPAPARTP